MNETITTDAATDIQPRTGNWATQGAVAAGRGMVLFGFTLAGLVLWVVFADSGGAYPARRRAAAHPVTVRAMRGLEAKVRRHVRRLVRSAAVG